MQRFTGALSPTVAGAVIVAALAAGLWRQK